MRRHVRALFAIAALGSLFAASAGTASAAECPNEAIRIAQGATGLPDCRAYEQVSPANSTGGVVGVDTKNKALFAAMRADGDAADFGSSSAVGEAERGALTTSNLAHRTADGWKSFSAVTTTEPGVPMDLSMAPSAPTPSQDMSRIMFRAPRSLGPPNPIASGGSVYLSAPEGKGAPIWLSRSTRGGTQPNPTPGLLPLGGSPDFSSGYFRYSTPLTSVAGDDLRTSGYGLYHFEGETITPAGVLPSGTVDPRGALPAGSGQAIAANGLGAILAEMVRNQVSADGSKLFFVTPGQGSEPKQLYVEEGGAPGRLVSHDLLGAPAPGGITDLNGSSSAIATNGFVYATPDGSRAIFRSGAALTGDAPETGTKTYRAEITPSAITLTYLPAVDGAVVKVSKNASTILFSTPGSVGGRSYYVWDEDRPATLYTVATDVTGTNQMPEAALSANGDVLVFTSGAEVEAGIAPRAETSYTQIYRWTKQSETTICISCRRDGGTPNAFGAHLANSASITTDNPAYPGGANVDPANQSTLVGNRKISADGSRVFFDTSDPLDPVHDVNGTRDVYMWENGQVHLLTSGRGDAPSLVLDSSEDGNDVMLVTKDGLVPSDTNQTYDVYNVRVDGGFAEPVKKTCEGDACQGEGSGSRQAAVPGSANLAWAGSQRESRKGKARARKAIVTSQLGRPGANSARVRIQVPVAGKVSIAGADVKNKARRVKRKGAVVIAVGLSSSGKSKLARRGHLKTTVRVTFRPKSGAATRKNVKLSFAGKKGGHR